MSMSLGDGFARRKKIGAEIETWIRRLTLAKRDSIQYQTKTIEGDEKFHPIPGSKKEFVRTYSIEECREKIDQLIVSDEELAIRISLTNQIAKGKLLDLDGIVRELTIPELLVLKNEIAPKKEKAARAIPVRDKGVEILEKGEKFVKWRSIKPSYRQKQTMGEKGNVITNQVIDYYLIDEVTDYGVSEREVFDLIDEIHAWMHRIKEAINAANKTRLIELK